MGFFAAFIGFLILMVFLAEGGGLVNQDAVQASIFDGVAQKEEINIDDERAKEILEMERQLRELEEELERLTRSNS